MQCPQELEPKLNPLPSCRGSLLGCLGLIVVTLAAYYPLWENGFTDLDDRSYITENPRVIGGLTRENVVWAWTTLHLGYWQPLTWMSLQLDATLFSQRQPGRASVPIPAGFHAVNLFWHGATAVLLFLVLRRLTERAGPSFVVAALFAVHPLHVESVAWAAERKDTLSTFFWVLTIAAYARYAATPRLGPYLLVVFLFFLGLLAKPMLVTLPCTLLLLDYWPLNRWHSRASSKRLVIEKLPLLALAAAISLLTFFAQSQGGGILGLKDLPLSVRLGHALASYGWYLEKTFWPVGLGIFYPHPRVMPPVSSFLLTACVLVVVTVFAVRERHSRPWLLVGWLWFLGTLVPVLGLFQSGNQGMADRFSYVPHVGLFIALVWTISDQWTYWKASCWLQRCLAVAMLVTLTGMTFVQVTYWRDPEAMWEHILAVAPAHDSAHFHLGNDLLERLGPAAALDHLQESVRLSPDCIEYRSALGKALFQYGELAAAADQFEDILKRDPHDPDAWYNLGEVRGAQGRWSESVICFERTRQINPRSAVTLAALGRALMNVGRSDEAALCWAKALEINAREPEALIGQGLLKLHAGRNVEAMEQFTAAASVSLKPEAFSLWGLMAGRLGKWPEAIQPQEAAIFLEEKRLQLQSRPDPRDLRLYRCRLSVALEAAGNHERARKEQEILRQMPADYTDSRPDR